MYVLEYICIDADNKFRSKTVFTEKPIEEVECIITSSVMIEKNLVHNGDIVLIPVKCVRNPFKRDDKHWLVFCEYKYPNDTNHQSNLRHRLEKVVNENPISDVNVAITQQFVLFKDEQPIGWNKKVDLVKNYSSQVDFSKHCQTIIDELTDAFLYVGIQLTSFNMEHMVGKWSISLGEQPLLDACDELFIVRYIIQRICFTQDITPCFIANPYGNAPIYTRCNFAISTSKMREENSLQEIVNACEKLQLKHLEQHKQFCKFNSRKFKYGQNNLQYDVNIVLHNNNSGYIEDRRCAGDCNAYEVLSKIVGTIVNEYNIQTMTFELSELQDKFNYRSAVNFNVNKPAIYKRDSLFAYHHPIIEEEEPQEEELVKKEEAEPKEEVPEKTEKQKKKEEKLAGLSGLARILKMNDDSDDEDDNTGGSRKANKDDNDDGDEGNRVKNIINALKLMNISHNILQSSHAPKSKSTFKEEVQQPMPQETKSVPANNASADMQMPQQQQQSPMHAGQIVPSNMMPMGQGNMVPPSMMPRSMVPMEQGNIMPMTQTNSQHPLGQPPPPNSLYTLPSQI